MLATALTRHFLSGQYFDKRYHIWLETDKGATNKLRVFKHTVPYYIPLKQLEEQHLAKNIRVRSSACTFPPLVPRLTLLHIPTRSIL